jgi:hypothetical protein
VAKKEIVADPNLVAYCGLYCGACPRYLRGGCPGCRQNAKATWCKVRSCCVDNTLRTCVDCADHPDPDTCALFNNPISRVIGFLFRSNRHACVLQIRELGVAGHAEQMAKRRRMSMRR